MRLHDTLTGRLKEVEPLEPGRVRMYTCGPTVYDFTHIGHLRPVLVGDVVARRLRAAGYEVRWISNFTDVDDRIIARANAEGIPPSQLAGRYIDDYLEVLRDIGISGIERFARVTEHMPQIVAMVSGLIEKGFAYPVDGDVYYSVEAKDDYGKLGKRSLPEMQAGARVAVDPRKRHPMDFALWKAAKPGEPSWESPWGPGRPGWHIECSAMSLCYLGETFDIHGGGGDLIFPHHENELAQSEAFTGEPFVSIWLHNAMVEVDREKMSKSLGNFVPLHDLVARYPAGVLRLFVLGTHYRKPLQYSLDALAEASRAHARMEDALRSWRAAAGRSDGAAGPLALFARRTVEAVDAALDDDLNTAGAIGAIFELVRAGNSALAAGGAERAGLGAAAAALDEAGDRLGLFVDRPEVQDRGGDPDLTRGLVDLLIGLRDEARAYRDWTVADRIRAGLAELGIAVEDTADGTRWKRASEGAAAGMRG